MHFAVLRIHNPNNPDYIIEELVAAYESAQAALDYVREHAMYGEEIELNMWVREKESKGCTMLMVKQLSGSLGPTIRERNMAVEGSCHQKAQARKQMTFTVVEQDATAVKTIAHWIYLNIETAPREKLRLALDECLEMRKFQHKKAAD